ncbi:MAG TPA: prenyltransferase [Candidatus Dormibacteraeota bacterium]
MLRDGELEQTGRAIAARQLPNGLLPWASDGYAEAWDHVEAAMALDLAGRRREAEHAYEWLVANQRPDGSWPLAYRHGEIEDHGGDANHAAYCATGIWHHFLTTDDRGFLTDMFPVLEKGVTFALDLQMPGGEIRWARGARGVYPKALVTCCSSIHLSLRCAAAAALELGRPRPDWETAADRVALALRERPHAFEPKPLHSMDWYYPVLGGVLRGDEAAARISDRWDEFVIDGVGVRCMADRPWVTVAETCELVLALDAAGLRDEALEVFGWITQLRAPDGAYWEGIVLPDRVEWPGRRPPWTAAAVLIANDALAGETPTSALFRTAALDEDSLESIA